MKRRCGTAPASARGTLPLGRTGVVLGVLSLTALMALAGGCLNPRPEELPSGTVAVVAGPDEESNGNVSDNPRGSEPVPTEGGEGDFGIDGDPGEPTGSGDADAGAPADAGLRALDTSAEGCPAASADDESADESAGGDEPE